jgi:hypothetical protein
LDDLELVEEDEEDLELLDPDLEELDDLLGLFRFFLPLALLVARPSFVSFGISAFLATNEMSSVIVPVSGVFATSLVVCGRMEGLT